MAEGENAWGRHAVELDILHHLLPSPTLPISRPVLDRIAVDSTEHQTKWLACIQKPCCKQGMYLLFKHWNHILVRWDASGKHLVLTEVTLALVSLSFPQLLLLHLLRETSDTASSPPASKPFYKDNCGYALQKPLQSPSQWGKISKINVMSTLSFTQPMFTIMQYHIWQNPRAKVVLEESSVFNKVTHSMLHSDIFLLMT